MKFSELNLTERTQEGIQAAKFENCTPVQEKVFQHSLKGADVMVQSQTGTGKTAAFLITILEKFAKAEHEKRCKAMIIVPTRELAVQIEQDARVLAKGFSSLRIGTFFGGVGYKKQDEELKHGVDIYIGTPGRLMDYGKLRKIDFSEMDVVVVDEADRLFDMGFYPDIRYMFQKMRNKEDRQTLLFSATLTNRARNLAWDFMNNPVEIEIEPEIVTVEEVRHELFHVSKSEKFQYLLRILAKEHPENAIIFTNTKSMAVEVAKRLEINGYDAHVLMGDLPQNKRLRVIQKMKQGAIKFLVATDVAARGLHVDDLEMVINYDIPEDYENYVHRVGRTARAGKSGLAITLACEQYVYGLEGIEEYIQMKLPVVWPEEDEYPVIEDKSAHLRFRDLVGSYRSGNGSRSSHGRKQGRSSSRSARKPGTAPQRSRSSATTSRERQNSGNSKHTGKSTNSSVPRTAKPKSQQRTSGNRKRTVKRETGIEQLSFEERLAYYKEKYGSELVESKQQTKSTRPAAESSQPKRSGTKPSHRGRQTQTHKGPSDSGRKRQSIPVGAEKATAAADRNQQDTGSGSKKKKGLLARLLRR